MVRLFSLLSLSLILFASFQSRVKDDRFLAVTVDPATEDLRMFWQNDTGAIINDFYTLRSHLSSQGGTLTFAMNGGMYREDYSPLGLYIGECETQHRINRVQEAYGNFYLQPNGVFCLTDHDSARIVTTTNFEFSGDIRYATQSGPMLVIDGKIHSGLTKGSDNLNVRNGVGVLPDGKALFVMSTEQVNFYDLALFFKNQGCQNALFLDGAVSRTYLPKEGYTANGLRFGVMIAVVE